MIIDSPDLRTLTADLMSAPDGVAPKVRAVVSKGALNIKTQLVDDMGRSRSFKAAARDINYDMIEETDSVAAEIGAQAGLGAGHAGSLAFIAYEGTATRGGTVPHPQVALDAEEPNFIAALEAVLGDSL